MKNAFVAIAAAFAVAGSAAFADSAAQTGAEVGKWTQDYSAAVKLSAEKELPLLLKFTGSDWCYWCKLMEANVFSKPAFQDWASTKIVLVSLDFPQAENVKTVPQEYVARNRYMLQSYGVQGFPTYFVLSPSGKAIGRLGASRETTPESFAREIEKILAAAPKNDAAKND